MKNIYIILAINAFLFSSPLVKACTVFVLNDNENIFYFANENTSRSNAKIWFVPGGEDFYSAAYIGFNGSAETGMNSEGLIFDWVAQFDDEWNIEPDNKTVRGNYGQRLLEQSANLDEAIAFFKKYPLPSLSKVRPVIADKSGEFAIIGVRDGKMFIDRYQSSYGIGTGLRYSTQEEIENILPEADTSKGFKLLEQLREEGQTPTRYSNSFNPKTGLIRIKHQNSSIVVELQLLEELKLGAHHYVLEDLHKSGKRSPQPLEISMYRFPVDVYEPIDSQDSTVIELVRKWINSLGEGKLTDYSTNKYRKQLSREIDSIRSDFNAVGKLQSLAIVKIEIDDEGRDYLFRLEFANALLLQKIRLDNTDRIDSMSSIAYEAKGRS